MSLKVHLGHLKQPACAFPSTRSPRSTPEPHFPAFFALAGASGRVATLPGPSSILHAGGRDCPSTCPLSTTEKQQTVEAMVLCYREYASQTN